MRKKTIYFLLGAMLLFFMGCQKSAQENTEAQQTTSVKELQEGPWRATLTLQEGLELPFNFLLEKKDSSQHTMKILNGSEILDVHDFRFTNDSVYITMHIFNTELQAKIGENTLEGQWVKKDYEKLYALPFKATYGSSTRFEVKNGLTPIEGLSGNWEVDFLNDDGSADKAVGVFLQSGRLLYGTFLTATGDYRYLEGSVAGDSLLLSCFDGEHAFMFTAKITAEGDKIEKGKFYSGKHWEQSWHAIKNDGAALPDATKLTYLKEGFDKVTFSFPNLQGEHVSLEDEKFQDKVVVVQLMGSWCPNCMDETKFLAPFYTKYQEQGLEIISLAYERSADFDKASNRVKVLKEKIGIDYELLIAGVSNKTKAAETLPMLNHVMAFPTTIVIDRNGQVRQIHTGFSGPGTGGYYDKFVEDFTLLIEKLLAEDATAA